MENKRDKKNNIRIQQKRINEAINRRKSTLIKKAHRLGSYDGVEVALIIYKHGKYTIYRSKDHKSWPPGIEEIVSRAY